MCCPWSLKKARHKGSSRPLTHERVCNLCKNGSVEDEKHFLLECDVYNNLRVKHNLENLNDIHNFFTEDNIVKLGKYLIEAFALRENTIIGDRVRKGEGKGGETQ